MQEDTKTTKQTSIRLDNHLIELKTSPTLEVQ